MYHAARIITYAILAPISLKPETYHKDIILHTASILSVELWDEKDVPTGGGLVSMMFPLRVIVLATPPEQQKTLEQRLDGGNSVGELLVHVST